MRTIAFAALCALATLPAQAQTQKVERITATGANLAGVCAGSLEMYGQFLSRIQNPDPTMLSEVQRTRDFFADTPRFPASEIAEAANAFIALMLGRLQRAATVAERQAIQREIIQVSTKCRASALANSGAQGNAPAAAPAPGGTAQPYVAPLETVPTQPYVAQPDTVQPYTTQPLVLDPVAPAQ